MMGQLWEVARDPYQIEVQISHPQLNLKKKITKIVIRILNDSQILVGPSRILTFACINLFSNLMDMN